MRQASTRRKDMRGKIALLNVLVIVAAILASCATPSARTRCTGSHTGPPGR